MHPTNIRHLLVALTAVAIIATLGLWSWNTLAELFGAPEAQFRHVAAAFVLLALLRRSLQPRRWLRRHVARRPGSAP